MPEAAEISFRYITEPKSFFYELQICFGDRCETIGGFAPDGGPDERLLRAALWVLTGGEEAHIRMDPQMPWGVRLTFRAVPLDQRAQDGTWRWGCEVGRVDLDGDNEPETDLVVLGYTTSIEQLARAVLGYAEERRGAMQASYALLAMRAALPSIEEAKAARGD